MGLFSKFENKMEDTFEGAANSLSNAPISPVQIAKKAEKQMRREKMVGAGKQYAPTLYTVLVNPDDDARLFGYYPTLAGETETYLKAKAAEEGLVMDGNPLVRFIVDDGLRHGKFDVIAEAVASPIIAQLRNEEMARYGLAPQQGRGYGNAPAGYDDPYAAPADDYGYDDYGFDQPADSYDDYGYDQADSGRKPPLPYVPEDEIDYSIDYGEYTFDSEDFEDYRSRSQQLGAHGAEAAAGAAAAAGSAAAGAGASAPNTVNFSGNGAPDAQAVHARLIDLNYQRAYDLAGTRVTIGRANTNDIVVQDINCSRQHAELKLTPQGVWVITDLHSVNGTQVNGGPIASKALYNGDHVTVGKTDFEFTQG